MPTLGEMTGAPFGSGFDNTRGLVLCSSRLDQANKPMMVSGECSHSKAQPLLVLANMLHMSWRQSPADAQLQGFVNGGVQKSSSAWHIVNKLVTRDVQHGQVASVREPCTFP